MLVGLCGRPIRTGQGALLDVGEVLWNVLSQGPHCSGCLRRGGWAIGRSCAAPHSCHCRSKPVGRTRFGGGRTRLARRGRANTRPPWNRGTAANGSIASRSWCGCQLPCQPTEPPRGQCRAEHDHRGDQVFPMGIRRRGSRPPQAASSLRKSGAAAEGDFSYGHASAQRRRLPAPIPEKPVRRSRIIGVSRRHSPLRKLARRGPHHGLDGGNMVSERPRLLATRLGRPSLSAVGTHRYDSRTKRLTLPVSSRRSAAHSRRTAS